MTTAREVITDALTFGLNRLSPGETLDADVGAVCLAALNNISDRMTGSGGMLFREVLTESTALTAATATIGAQWVGLVPGVRILGATVKLSGQTLEYDIALVNLDDYQGISIKTIKSIPDRIAYDGLSTIYIYPVPNGEKITLRTNEVAASFADLDTVYVMPPGCRSAIADMLAEKMAPSLLGAISPAVAAAASSARMRLEAANILPAIIGANGNPGRLASFLRGY